MWPVLSRAPPPRAEVGAGEAVGCSEPQGTKRRTRKGGCVSTALQSHTQGTMWSMEKVADFTWNQRRCCLGREVLGPRR